MTVSTPESTYAYLCAPFDHTFTDVRGGVSLEYVTGEQVVSRLNDVLGAGGWSFRVLDHQIHTEADEIWVLGELVAEIDGHTVTRQQFGSQKIKRSRSTGAPLDIGFDLKGAATDSEKKCASLIGVGLYLSQKKAPAPTQGRARQSAPKPVTPQAVGTRAAPTPITASSAAIICSEPDCGTELVVTERRDGTMRTPAELAQEGRDRFQKVCCVSCFRKYLALERAPAPRAAS